MKQITFVFLIFLSFSCASQNKEESVKLSNKAQVLIEQQKFEESIPVLEKSLELDGNNKKSRLLLAAAYIQLKEYKKAEEITESLLQNNPADKQAQLLKMIILKENGQNPSETLEHLNKSIESNPKYFMNYYYKGQELINLEQYEEAIEAFNQALEIEPNHRYSVTERALAKYKLGRTEEACKDWSNPGGGSSKYLEEYCK